MSITKAPGFCKILWKSGLPLNRHFIAEVMESFEITAEWHYVFQFYLFNTVTSVLSYIENTSCPYCFTTTGTKPEDTSVQSLLTLVSERGNMGRKMHVACENQLISEKGNSFLGLNAISKSQFFCLCWKATCFWHIHTVPPDFFFLPAEKLIFYGRKWGVLTITLLHGLPHVSDCGESRACLSRYWVLDLLGFHCIVCVMLVFSIIAPHAEVCLLQVRSDRRPQNCTPVRK